MSSHRREFRAMGTDCSVLIFAASEVFGGQLCDLAIQRVEILEQCWSRFRPSSELSRLNEQAGAGPVEVSDDLFTLVEAMSEACALTGGLFDPTVLANMRAIGYDVDYAAVIARDALFYAGMPRVSPVPGMGSVILDASMQTVSLPVGVGLDPGAIGKGLGADIIVDEFLAAGADGVLINLGGDIALGGLPGTDPHWNIDVVDERDLQRHASLPSMTFPAGIAHAGVATSTSLGRVWGTRHHVIDPRTGQCAESDLVQVTISANSGWWAEVAATTALIAGSAQAPSWLDDHRLQYLLLSSTTMQTSDVLAGVHSG